MRNYKQYVHGRRNKSTEKINGLGQQLARIKVDFEAEMLYNHRRNGVTRDVRA